MNNTLDLRNRVYPASEEEILAHLFDAERMGYAQTRDALPRYADRYVWDEPEPAVIAEGLEGDGCEGEPVSGKRTAAWIGAFVCGCLLLAGLAYLAWAGANGGFPWQRYRSPPT